MIYDLARPLDRERAAARFAALNEKGSCIELSEKFGRTLHQNSYLHLLLGVVAMETGNTLADTKQHYFKWTVNPDLFVRRKTDALGNTVTTVRSSAELSTDEMATAITRLQKWAADNGIYLPRPEDTARLRDVEIEMGRMKSYL